MKENKKNLIAVRLNDDQIKTLEAMVTNGVVKNKSEGIQYLINKQMILG